LLTSALVVANATLANAQVSIKNFIGPSVEVGIQFKNLDSSTTDGGDKVEYNNDTNTLGRLAFNYGLPTTERTVLSVGASYTAGKSKASVSDYIGTVNVVYDNMYALYVAPTYVVSDTTAIFAKASYNSARAKYTYAGSYGGGYSSPTKRIDGFGYGVGVTTFVSKDVFLKAELEAINYGDNTVDETSLKSKETNATISVGIKF
jgi:hypothetical protein